MAKTKKQVLSLDERLEQALVPESEQPYSVPENWVWTRLSKITQINMGQSPKGEDTTSDEKYIGLIGGAADMGTIYPNVSRYTKKPTKLSTDQDVIISIRATLGRPIFSDGIYCLGRGVAAVSSSQYQKSLLRYLFLSNENYLYQNATGTTFAQVNATTLGEMIVPVPPMPEQQRIVTQIESLFQKLDSARDLVQNALDSFESRKAAILHKAFTGELTVNWRVRNNIGIDSWSSSCLKDIAYGFKYGTSEKADYSFSGIPVIRIPNILDDSVSLSDIKYLSSENVDEEHLLKENDILIIRSNGSRDIVGKSALVPVLEGNYTYASYLIRLRLSKAAESKFIQYFLNSTMARSQMFRSAKSSAGINNINSRELGNIEIHLPQKAEQQEIVRILDSLLENEQKAKDLCDILDQIDLMKKSILARAFRGELGTNDPNEESALELLKDVLSETADQK